MTDGYRGKEWGIHVHHPSTLDHRNQARIIEACQQLLGDDEDLLLLDPAYSRIRAWTVLCSLGVGMFV